MKATIHRAEGFVVGLSLLAGICGVLSSSSAVARAASSQPAPARAETLARLDTDEIAELVDFSAADLSNGDPNELLAGMAADVSEETAALVYAQVAVGVASLGIAVLGTLMIKNRAYLRDAIWKV